MNLFCEETRRRIRISVAAYAYEFENHSILSDVEFDTLSYEIDPSVETGNEVLDNFFRTSFDPCTGMWIRKHPELHKVKELYKLLVRVHDKL